jgi:hypothetical protein
VIGSGDFGVSLLLDKFLELLETIGPETLVSVPAETELFKRLDPLDGHRGFLRTGFIKLALVALSLSPSREHLVQRIVMWDDATPMPFDELLDLSEVQ